MMTVILIALCAILTFVSAKSSYYILKVLAGVSYWGLAVWAIYNPFTTRGSPTDVIVLALLFIVGIAFFFWPFWYSKSDGQEVGGRLRLPFMPTDEQERESRNRNVLGAYYLRRDTYNSRLNARLRGERPRK